MKLKKSKALNILNQNKGAIVTFHNSKTGVEKITENKRRIFSISAKLGLGMAFVVVGFSAGITPANAGILSDLLGTTNNQNGTSYNTTQYGSVQRVVMGRVVGVREVPIQNNNNGTFSAGGIVGGIVGGLVGHQFGGGLGREIMTGAGAVVGNIAGKNVQNSLDKQMGEQLIIQPIHEFTDSNGNIRYVNVGSMIVNNEEAGYNFQPGDIGVLEQNNNGSIRFVTMNTTRQANDFGNTVGTPSSKYRNGPK